MTHRNPLKLASSIGFWTGACALLVLGLSPAPARADTQLGLDLDFATPIDAEGDSGGGFAVRAGWQLHAPLVVITPEAVFNYESFGGTFGPSVYRGVGGMRLGVGELLRLGAFGHAGVGRLSADVPGPDPSRTDFTYDLGIFLDLTLLPLINLGIHGAYK